jgi:hypothetical protein
LLGSVICYYQLEDDSLEYASNDSYPFADADIDAEMWGDVIKSECRRVYIHPDSLPLLEPIINDVVEVREGNFYKTVRLHDVYDKQELQGKWRLHRIIQRNGKPFFWPESEEEGVSSSP